MAFCLNDPRSALSREPGKIPGSSDSPEAPQLNGNSQFRRRMYGAKT